MNRTDSRLREAIQTAQLHLKFGHYYCRTLRDWGVTMDMLADMSLGGIFKRVGRYGGTDGLA